MCSLFVTLARIDMFRSIYYRATFFNGDSDDYGHWFCTDVSRPLRGVFPDQSGTSGSPQKSSFNTQASFKIPCCIKARKFESEISRKYVEVVRHSSSSNYCFCSLIGRVIGHERADEIR
jgi:hypothetical protein